MSLGVHFALSKKDLAKVLDFDDPEELVEFISEELEERYLETHEWSYETDKAWDAIHRCLTDGWLRYESGPFPLAYAVLGGQPLDVGDGYTACLVQPAQVRQTSAALAGVSRDWMRKRYETLASTDYDGPHNEDDFESTWENFEGLRLFLGKAADAEFHRSSENPLPSSPLSSSPPQMITFDSKEVALCPKRGDGAPSRGRGCQVSVSGS